MIEVYCIFETYCRSHLETANVQNLNRFGCITTPGNLFTHKSPAPPNKQYRKIGNDLKLINLFIYLFIYYLNAIDLSTFKLGVMHRLTSNLYPSHRLKNGKRQLYSMIDLLRPVHTSN